MRIDKKEDLFKLVISLFIMLLVVRQVIVAEVPVNFVPEIYNSRIIFVFVSIPDRKTTKMVLRYIVSRVKYASISQFFKFNKIKENVSNFLLRVLVKNLV